MVPSSWPPPASPPSSETTPLTTDSRQSNCPRERHGTHGERNIIVGAAASAATAAAAAAQGLEVDTCPSTDTNDPKRKAADNRTPQDHQSNWRKSSKASILHTSPSPPPSDDNDDDEGGEVFGDAGAVVVAGASTGKSEARVSRVLKPGQIGHAPFRLLPSRRGLAMDGERRGWGRIPGVYKGRHIYQTQFCTSSLLSYVVPRNVCMSRFFPRF